VGERVLVLRLDVLDAWLLDPGDDAQVPGRAAVVRLRAVT
jgi:hypothetical protein